MPQSLVVLDAMPSAADFYALYWNRRPFVVRGAVPEPAMAGLIAADVLAGLSMEDGVQSRMVKTAGDQRDWSCRSGPFSEEDFASAGDTDWSLLVQNVEQFHPDTGALLRYFNFAPRWLMDDIMVSFSARGGSVGPHIDSYHVFLVQGQGRRRWKVGRQPIEHEVFIEGIDLKVLKNNFEGDEIEVTCGDVLYLPPQFAHEGTTLDDALTFSVGFLGPKLSELLSGYGQHVAEREDLDQRYVGNGLDVDSAGFAISAAAADTMRDRLAAHLNAKDFSQWLVAFFTEPSHEDFGNDMERETPLSGDAFKRELSEGASLIKPEYVKFAITASDGGTFCLGFGGQSVTLGEDLFPVIQKLMKETAVNAESAPEILSQPAALDLLLRLYNHQALEFDALDQES